MEGAGSRGSRPFTHGSTAVTAVSSTLTREPLTVRAERLYPVGEMRPMTRSRCSRIELGPSLWG
jgi:hypothetical protein